MPRVNNHTIPTSAEYAAKAKQAALEAQNTINKAAPKCKELYEKLMETLREIDIEKVIAKKKANTDVQGLLELNDRLYYLEKYFERLAE